MNNIQKMPFLTAISGELYRRIEHAHVYRQRPASAGVGATPTLTDEFLLLKPARRTAYSLCWPWGEIPMNRVATVIALSAVICVGTRALAVDSIDQSTMSKRQML